MQALLGAVLAIPLLVVTRQGLYRPQRIWAFALVLATLIYVGFSLGAGAAPTRDLLGVAIYLPFAVAGWRGSNLAVAAGWAAHVGWDIALYGALGAGVSHAPAWYPGVCSGFDIAVAAWFVWRERSHRTAFAAPVS